MSRSRTLTWCAIALLLIAVLALLVSLRSAAVAERGLRRHLADEAGQRVRMVSVRVNPLTMSGTIRGLQVDSPDGVRVLSVDTIRFRLAPGSLTGGALTARELAFERPQLYVTLDARGAPRWRPALLQVPDDAPPLRIDRLAITQGELRLRKEEASAPSGGAELSLENLSAEIGRIDARAAQATVFDVSATVDGGTVRATGDANLHSGVAAAALTVNGLPLQQWLPFRAGLWSLDIDVPQGTLTATGDLSVGEGRRHFDGTLSVRDLRMSLADDNTLKAGEARFDTVTLVSTADCIEVTAPLLSLHRAQIEMTMESDLGAAVAPLLAPLLDGDGPRRPGAASGKSSGADPNAAAATHLQDCTTTARSGRAAAMPRWSFGGIALDDGELRVRDARGGRSEMWRLSNVAGTIANATGRGTARGGDDAPRLLNISLEANVNEHGRMRLDAQHDAAHLAQLGGAGVLALSNLDAARLTTYLPDTLARRFSAGRVDWTTRYRLLGGTANTENELTGRGLVVVPVPGTTAATSDDAQGASPQPADDDGDRPGAVSEAGQRMDLALMLLTDSDRRAQLSFTAGDAWWAAFDAALIELTAEPSLSLARLLDPQAETALSIAFEPADTVLTPQAQARLATLAGVLSRRPLLRLAATGMASADVDRRALAQRQLRLHVTLATSARPTATNAPAAIDFADGKVQTVLDEFAGERLDARTRRTLDALPGARATGPAARASYYEQVYVALADKETVSDRALRQLARYRAIAVSNELRRLGVAPSRLGPPTAGIGAAAVGLAPATP